MNGLIALKDAMASVINVSGIVDIVDILLVALLIYNGLKLIRETRAVQLIKGIMFLVALYVVAFSLKMKALPFIMQYMFTIGAWALLVVFQPELRRALESMGRTKLSKWFDFASDFRSENIKWGKTITAICEATDSMSKKRIGALMVLERQSRLGDIINTGTTIDATPSAELIGNVFFPNSPLHDGALIMREGRLCAAGCFLPLSENYDISKEMGTRHRAALGMSEQSDAVVIIVSEETGVITVAQNGKLKRGYTKEQLAKELSSIFMADGGQDKPERKLPFLKNKTPKQEGK